VKPHAARTLLGTIGTIATVAWALAAPTSRPTGVVIVTLDTTRADHLSPYGFMDASMPYLERLAREGVVFDRAISVAPLTLPAHASLFTGLLPPRHGVRDNADAALREEHVTLAEILRGEGFRTGAFVGSAILDADRGLSQGFDMYRGAVSVDRKATHILQRSGDEVVTDATRWLDEVGSSPFLLWVHLYDAHRPYDPPEPYRSHYADAYVGELLFVDAQIGRLLAALEQRRILNRTIVVAVADHGESRGEHGERDHGIFVYDNVLRVPLIIRSPVLPPRRVADQVRLTDIMSTVLDMLGLAAPPADGVSLVDLMMGAPEHLDLDAYAESLYPQRFGWSPLRALSDGRFKVIDAPRPELYDLHRDPFEQHNLYSERRELAEAMRAKLRTVTIDRRASAPVGEDVRSRLAALGYIGSVPPAVPPEDSFLPDPKDRIATRHGAPGHARQETTRFP
jgi:arylsulfatase A-like enzyme